MDRFLLACTGGKGVSSLPCTWVFIDGCVSASTTALGFHSEGRVYAFFRYSASTEGRVLGAPGVRRVAAET